MTRAPAALPPGPPTILLVMGVSGAGKTTLGKALAKRLGWTFQEGDDLHTPASVAKMKAGRPLDDDDRAPWLARVQAWISDQLAAGRSGVISCSALKRAYRRTLVGGRDDVVLVYLEGAEGLVARRLQSRRGHFFPPSLLASQFEALQPPDAGENPIVVTVDRPVKALVEQVVAVLAQRRGGPLGQPPSAKAG